MPTPEMMPTVSTDVAWRADEVAHQFSVALKAEEEVAHLGVPVAPSVAVASPSSPAAALE